LILDRKIKEADYKVSMIFEGVHMELARREFLKATGAGAGGIFSLGVIRPDKILAEGTVLPLKKRIGQVSTICP